MAIMVGPTILETSAGGELQIPAGVLGAGPHARFRLEHDGLALRLIPEASGFREATPSGARAQAFREWVARLPKRGGPAIPAEALRRENLYE